MVLSFGFLAPLGFFLARHFRFFARRHTCSCCTTQARCSGSSQLALAPWRLRWEPRHRESITHMQFWVRRCWR